MATKDRTALKDEFKNGNLATGERFVDLIDSMKVVQEPVADPAASGTSLSFIDSISQNADGKITATKKTLDLTNAHELNPFKGWYKTGDTLPTDGFDGAYLYFKDTSELTGQTTIYRWNGTTYADTGTVVDTSNVQTFETGQAVNGVAIDGTQLANPLPNALAKARDVGEALYGKPAWKSQASISLTPGMSSSSSTKYSFDNVPILYADKTYQLDIVIQNNAIGIATLYLKDSAGARGYFSTDGNRTNARTITDGYSAELTLESDIYYASFSITDANIANSGDIIVKITEKNSGTTGLKYNVNILKEDVENLKDETQDLQNRINAIPSESVKNCGTLSKEIISLARPYYFAQGWRQDNDFGYLDSIINNLPQGKHFLIYTDIHLDYNSTFSLEQNQPIIMKYVHDRLSGCKVIFGGDIIGSRTDEESAKKEILYFIDDNYTLFGSEFIPVLGDHDTDRVSGGLPQGSQLSEQFLYDSVFKWSHLYGATQDYIGINAIDTISSFSADKKEAWKNYMKMHYYVDDQRQKIRFIVVQQGAIFRTITNNYNTPCVQLPFIAQSIFDAPDDYDIVVVSHEFQISKNGTGNQNIWDRKLGNILACVKNHSSYTLSRPAMTDADEIAVYNAVAALYPSSFDFTEKSGNVVILQGDEHYDYANYYDYSTYTSNTASEDYTLGQNDVLRVIFDRACLVQNPGFPTSQFTNINFVLKCRRAPAQLGGNVLLGTTYEVLFDIITITNDNKIVLTRVGDKPTAGRFGAYPIFTEEVSYDIGDIVIWYTTETISNIEYYIVKAYQFNTAHAAGSWDISEVDEYVVTEPYIRTFDLR